MKNIVILGGGFAGVTAGVHLKKHLKGHKDVQLTVVDKNPYHTFTPSLYELAASEQIENNVIIPFKEIFDKNVNYVQDSITNLDTKKKTISLGKNKALSYDYLLIALGSQAAYMNIPGLQKYSIPMKSVEDAVKIKDSIKDMCCTEGVCHRKVRVIIGGGGFTGTEIAAELINYKDKLARQHHLDRDCLDITIIQGSDRLLKELDPHVSTTAQKRLSHPCVHFAFGGHITEVTAKEVKTDDGKAHPYNILIWTGGVEANNFAKANKLPTNKRGQLLVNNYMQVEGFDNIFAAGDIAGFIDPKTQKPVPNVAQVAEDEGKIAADNIMHGLDKKPLVPYIFSHWGYIVPMRGKYSAAELMGFHIDGFFAWVLQQFVYLWYLIHILPFFNALLRWATFEKTLLE